MSITALRKAFTAPALAAVMVVGAAVGAQAGDGNVSFADIRGESAATIEGAPVAASRDRTAIIAYGASDHIMNILYQASRHIEENSEEDIFLLRAPDDDGDDEYAGLRTTIAVYTRGIQAGTVTVGEGADPHGLLADVRQLIDHGVTNTASLETEEPEPSSGS